MGLIEKNHEASLIVLDGDPIEDIANLDHISSVMFKGERINRSEILQQDRP